MFEDEEWRPIAGFPDYEVSDYGRISNIRTGKTLKPHLGDGYYRISLSVNGKSSTFPVHRLVAKAFVPGETEQRWWVDHIDTDKSYNHASNLEWVTPVENLYRARAAGLIKTTPGGTYSRDMKY